VSDGHSKVVLVEGDPGRLLVLALGPDQDLSAERENMTAPRVMQPVQGDFVATVRVSGPVQPGDKTVAERTGFSGAGLILMVDEKNYARLERAALVRGGTRSPYVIWEVREDGRIRRFGIPQDYPDEIDEEKPFWLRMKREGNSLRAFATQDNDDWHELTGQSMELPDEVAIGVAAVNVSKYPFGPEFSELSIDKAEEVISRSSSECRQTSSPNGASHVPQKGARHVLSPNGASHSPNSAGHQPKPKKAQKVPATFHKKVPGTFHMPQKVPAKFQMPAKFHTH